jgi:hypothetical protein
MHLGQRADVQQLAFLCVVGHRALVLIHGVHLQVEVTVCMSRREDS